MTWGVPQVILPKKHRTSESMTGCLRFFFFPDPRVGFLWVFYRDFIGLPGWMDPLLDIFFKSGYMCHGRSVVAILGMGKILTFNDGIVKKWGP